MVKPLALQGVFDTRLARVLQKEDSFKWFDDEISSVATRFFFVAILPKMHYETYGYATLENEVRLRDSLKDMFKGLKAKGTKLYPTPWQFVLGSKTYQNIGSVNGKTSWLVRKDHLDCFDLTQITLTAGVNYEGKPAITLVYHTDPIGLMMPWFPNGGADAKGSDVGKPELATEA